MENFIQRLNTMKLQSSENWSKFMCEKDTFLQNLYFGRLPLGDAILSTGV